MADPRNLRNNNPGNIEDGPFARRQPGYAGSDGRFALFDSPDNGYRAANALIDVYGQKGLTTPAQIIQRWAPAADGNNPAWYAQQFQQRAGIDPHAPLGGDPVARAKLLGVVTQVEGGKNPYAVEGIAKALTAPGNWLARANPMPVPVAPTQPQAAPVAQPAQAPAPTPPRADPLMEAMAFLPKAMAPVTKAAAQPPQILQPADPNKTIGDILRGISGNLVLS